MNLWIITIFSWIYVSFVTAESTWFVQDTPLGGVSDHDLFLDEHLIVVNAGKANVKPAGHQSLNKQKSTNPDKNKKEEPKHDSQQKASSKTANVQKQEVVSGRVLPAQVAAKKPTTAKKPATTKKPKSTKVLHKTQNTSFDSGENDDPLCNPEKNISCLMVMEGLILVNKKKSESKSKPKTSPTPAVKHTTTPRTTTPKALQTPTHKEKTVQVTVHRKLLQTDGLKLVEQVPVAIQPLESEEDLSNDDDLPAGIEAVQEEDEEDLREQEEEAEMIVRRMRRQAAEDPGSGGGGVDFEETTTINDDLVFEIPLETTLERQIQPGETFTEANQTSYKTEFESKLNEKFQNVSGFVDVKVTNVSVDENNRITFDWTVTVSENQLPGNSTTDKAEFVTSVIVPEVNNMTVSGSKIFKPKSLNDTLVFDKVVGILGDQCLASDACMSGYDCRRDGTSALCRHRCYSSGLINSCLNGGSCQLNDLYQPYCLCGQGYSGTTCEHVPQSGDDYSTGEIAGATVAGAVAMTGIISAGIYLAAFRKKKEEDMEYSYYGDTDSSPSAYQDPNAALGTTSYYIDRPSISIQPLDIYAE